MGNVVGQRDTLHVTGANAAYFPMLCVLQGAYQLYMPGTRLMVCDFGLTLGQARFLAAKNILLPKPDGLLLDRHVYYYKGSMYRYMEHLDFASMLWIDCDCLPVGSLDQELKTIVRQNHAGENHLLAAVDVNAPTLGDFVRNHRYQVAPMTRLITDRNLSLDLPYLSAGLFLLNNHAVLDQYARIMQDIPEHLLFDQNAFNVAVHSGKMALIELDRDVWNSSGALLEALTWEDTANALPVLYRDGKRVWNIHVSDGKEQQHVQLTKMDVAMPGGRFRGLLREPRREDLRRLILDILANYLLETVENNRLLRECGALE
ncbi:MAG: hypothetical protein HQL78_07685 [Magnetococcales bacterium]|nr:hypothetical protein [Magnetococcales bacterium]